MVVSIDGKEIKTLKDLKSFPRVVRSAFARLLVDPGRTMFVVDGIVLRKHA